MQYGTIKGVDKKVSRFIIGTMDFRDEKGSKEDFARLDKAFEMGINTIDTAQGYGFPNIGASELAIGKWMESRGNREQVVLTTKGCHPNMFRTKVHSYDLSADLFDSLAKMKTDYIDVYYLHRDDIHTTVKELMDTLNWHYREGRIRAFGVANWSYERIREANEYARANGLQPMVVAEEHYSLAEMIEDPFIKGSGTVSGPNYKEARKWFADNDIPIASYSSLSGGFLSGRITRKLFEENPDSINPGTRRAYCYDVNFRRLERAQQMAKEKGCTVAQICLAYTMSGEMDVYPIIGAVNEEEIRSSVEALDIKLTQAECDWLDLTSDEK